MESAFMGTVVCKLIIKIIFEQVPLKKIYL